MSIKDANVAITIGGDSKQFRRELKKADDSLATFNKKANKVVGNLAKVGAAATAAGGAVVAALYTSQKDVIDSLAKTADALSMTTESLQALGHLAALSGVETKALNNSLQKMQKVLGEASRKGGLAAEAFEDMGVNIDSILSLSPDKQLIELSKAFSGVQNSAIKASIASEIFGRDGLKMLKVMDQLNDEGLQPTIKSLEDMGASLSRVDAKAVEDANDAVEKAQVAATAMAQAMTVALAPAVEAAANKFVAWSKSTGGLVNKIKELEPQIKIMIEIGKGLALIYGATLVGAMGRYATAQAVMIRNTMKQITFMKALDLAAGSLRKGMALLGGPLGLVTLAASALAVFGTSAKETMPPARDLAGVIDELAESYGNMSDKAKGAAIVDLDQSIRAQNVKLQEQKKILGEIADKRRVLDVIQAKVDTSSLKGQALLDENLRLSKLYAEHDAKHAEAKTKALAEEERLQNSINEAVAFKNQLLATDKAKETTQTEETKEPAKQELAIIVEANEEKLTAQQMYFERKAAAEDEFNRQQLERTGKLADDEVAAAEAAAARIDAIRKGSFEVASGIFSNLSSLMSSENKKQFEIGKKAAKAGAMVDGLAAAVGSFKAGAKIGGPVLGGIYAASSLVATKSMIDSINSQSFGGGSTGGAPAGGAPQAPQEQPAQSTFTVSGLNPTNLFSGEQVADMLQDYQRNGGRLIIE